MVVQPVELIQALSDDVLRETGYTYDFFKSCTHLPPSFDHHLASARSIVHSLLKKLLPKETREQDRACLAKFRLSNEACRTWSLRLNTSADEELWGSWKQELYNFFYPAGMPLIESLDHIFSKGKCGPGASIGAPGGDFYSKMFASCLTSTSQGLIEHYESNVRRLPEWYAAEVFRSQHTHGERIVRGSRLSFVPKNDTISRSICTEPTLNMFYQLGLGSIVTKRLKSFYKIDLQTQSDVNAGLARMGSLDDAWSTIDLESASDTISRELIKELLPPEVFLYFDLLRCRETVLQGECIPLHMISSMGNGFTFPLQTVIFATLVSTIYKAKNLKAQVAVFGDDIAVRTAVFDTTVRWLELAGFKVNDSKSFRTGPFRESCGRDFFLGRNIRGPYLKALDTPQDIYAAINAVTAFIARTGFNALSLARLLRSRVDQGLQIPLWEDPSSGIRTPWSLISSRRMSETTHGTIYSKYVFKPKRIRIGDGVIFSRRRKIIYNPSGLLVGFLSGMALSSGLPLREEGRWKKKRLSCSYWDSLGSAPVLLDGIDLRRWETATYLIQNG